mgnify:CR=1 FL=1
MERKIEIKENGFYHRENILGREVLKNGIKSLEQQIHPQTIAKWILNFIHNGVVTKPCN